MVDDFVSEEQKGDPPICGIARKT